MNNRAEYWIDLAEYDIQTAKAMLETKRFLYVGFMCHQSVEKSLKAIIARDCAEGEISPKIHDLTKLAIRAGIFETMSDTHKDFLDDLNPLNIEARYPEHKRIISLLTKDKCNEIIAETEGLLCWIKKQL